MPKLFARVYNSMVPPLRIKGDNLPIYPVKWALFSHDLPEIPSHALTVLLLQFALEHCTVACVNAASRWIGLSKWAFSTQSRSSCYIHMLPGALASHHRKASEICTGMEKCGTWCLYANIMQ